MKNNYDEEDEQYTEHAKKMPINQIIQFAPSICKIFTKKSVATGFFMKIKKKKEYCFLITNFHVISQQDVNSRLTILITLENGKIISIKLEDDKRIIKCFDKPIDITIIEILDIDGVKDFIDFLSYDRNYEDGYEQYKNKDIFILQHPEGKDLECGMGKIINIIGNQFEHSVDTDKGSSGSPIILISNSRVVGIHKKRLKNSKNNEGTFIGILIDKFTELEERIFSENEEKPKNELSGEEISHNETFKNEISYDKITENETFKNEISEDKTNEEDKISKNEINDNKIENKIDKNVLSLDDLSKNGDKKISKKKKKTLNNKMTDNGIEKSKKRKNKFKKMKYNNNQTSNDENFFETSESEIIIKYNIFYDNENDYRLFGDKFVENNIYNCKMLINNKEYDLWCFIEKNLIKNIKENNEIEVKLIEIFDKNHIKNIKENNEIEVKLIEISKIVDMSYMFSKVSSLSSFSDFSKWNTNEVEDMSHMFDECLSKSLPDISSWDMSNVIDISYMFYKCSELLSLPDISKWNTCNVMDIKYIFSECRKLESLPDISSWNTSNIDNMSYAFYYCAKIKHLPDISKWDMKKVTDINYMFANCKNLESIPDISKWELTKIIFYNNLFEGCKSKEIKEFKKTFFMCKIFDTKKINQ